MNIEIYYESLCPDSQAFITQQLHHVWKEYGEYLNPIFKPFGKATVNNHKLNNLCKDLSFGIMYIQPSMI